LRSCHSRISCPQTVLSTDIVKFQGSPGGGSGIDNSTNSTPTFSFSGAAFGTWIVAGFVLTAICLLFSRKAWASDAPPEKPPMGGLRDTDSSGESDGGSEAHSRILGLLGSKWRTTDSMSVSRMLPSLQSPDKKRPTPISTSHTKDSPGFPRTRLSSQDLLSSPLAQLSSNLTVTTATAPPTPDVSRVVERQQTIDMQIDSTAQLSPHALVPREPSGGKGDDIETMRSSIEPMHRVLQWIASIRRKSSKTSSEDQV